MKDLISILSAHWPSLLLLALSAVPACYMHVHDHGKLRWFTKGYTSFAGKEQWRRKFKYQGPTDTTPAFFGSTTFLVALTDLYHASQALMRILMSLSITLAIGAPWYWFLLIWGAYATIHALFYKLLSR